MAAWDRLLRVWESGCGSSIGCSSNILAQVRCRSRVQTAFNAQNACWTAPICQYRKLRCALDFRAFVVSTRSFLRFTGDHRPLSGLPGAPALVKQASFRPREYSRSFGNIEGLLRVVLPCRNPAPAMSARGHYRPIPRTLPADECLPRAQSGREVGPPSPSP
jgi:hypothetical protein